jgi:hypothetical protein
MLPRVRSAALIAATVLMGISWSFALVRIKTGAYPFLWAAALPLLAFYFSSGPRPFQISRYVPAGMVALYTLVLWHITASLGMVGALVTVAAAAGAAGALWLGAYLHSAALARQKPTRSRRAAKRARNVRATAGR